MEKSMTPIAQYLWKYPQLSLPVSEGMSKSPEYLAIVRKGILPSEPTFPLQETGLEETDIIDTPSGPAEVLYLPNREIFEYFVHVLGYRCEPVPIPASMGSMMISGINNWRKIEAHKKEYLSAGGTDWKTEFREFTGKQENYKDVVLLISRGNYSALSAQDAGFKEEEWLEKSRTIRTYHELSHFVSRKLFPQNKEPLRDEIVADSIGILAAFGCYDELLAKKVLGIEKETYRAGGRLENYVENEQLQKEALRAKRIIEELNQFYTGQGKMTPFELLLAAEEEKAGVID